MHESVHHLDHIQACAQCAVDRAHLQADDAATQDQHALGYFGQLQCACAVDHAGIVGHERQMHRLAARGDDAGFETHHLCLAGFVLRCARGFFHRQVVAVDKHPITAQHSDFAHLGHGRQTAGELANHFFFVTAQVIDVEFGLAVVHTDVSQMAHLVHHRRHMQQRFGRDATHVQTHTAQLGIALDDGNLQTQVCGTECGAVATGATA